jgi:hypothetical protein
MKYFAIIGALALTGCLPFEEQSAIRVEGEATLLVEPDEFEIASTILTYTESREQTLARLAEIYSTLKATLPELEGLNALKMEASEASISSWRDPDCTENSYDDQGCPIVAYGAEIALTISGSPASSAGPMLALLSELKVDDAELRDYKIAGDGGRRDEALKAAIANARDKAAMLAAASDASIGRIIRIESGRGMATLAPSFGDDEIIVTGSRVRRPAVSLELEPQPIEVSARVVATFAIE